jgi:hypothetical protein
MNQPHLPNAGNKPAHTLFTAKYYLEANIFAAGQENFPHFMERRGSKLWTRGPATCPYPKVDKFNLRPCNLFKIQFQLCHLSLGPGRGLFP